MLTLKEAIHEWNYGRTILRLRIYYKDGDITNYYHCNKKEIVLFSQQIWEYEKGIVAIISYITAGE